VCGNSTNDRATLAGMGQVTGHVAEARPADSAAAARRRALFEEAVATIEQCYEDRLSLADLAQTIFTSKRQLQRAFAEAGTSFQATLHTIRMERSTELLIESSLPVSAIAHLVGYRWPSDFTKAFRRHYQLVPTQLRSINSNWPVNEVLPRDCKCGSQPLDPAGGPTTAATQARRAAPRTRVSLEDPDRRPPSA